MICRLYNINSWCAYYFNSQCNVRKYIVNDTWIPNGSCGSPIHRPLLNIFQFDCWDYLKDISQAELNAQIHMCEVILKNARVDDEFDTLAVAGLTQVKERCSDFLQQVEYYMRNKNDIITRSEAVTCSESKEKRDTRIFNRMVEEAKELE